MAQPEWERARAPDAQRVWETVLRPLAPELRAQARPLATEVVRAVRELVPDLFPDEQSIEDNRASTESNVLVFAEAVEVGADPARLELSPASVAYTRDSARRGIGLPLLLRSWRLEQSVVWDGMLAQLGARARDAHELTIATQLASAWMFAFVDHASTLTEQMYTAERERWLRSASAVRAETIEALLDGRERDAQVAASRLRYELDRNHIGVVAWLEAADENTDPISALESAVARLAETCGAESTLVHPVGMRSVMAWLGSRAEFDPEAVAQAAFDSLESPGVLAGLGSAAAGVAGFRATHVEAGHARRVASLSERRPGTVTHFERVALAALGTSDPDLAEAFVERELGALRGDDDVSLRLVATLRAYLDENASRGRAAKRLGIHENTVSYRVRQAEEILGRDVDTDALELRVALSLSEAVRLRR